MQTILGVAALLGVGATLALIDYLFSLAELTNNDPVRE